MCLLPARDFRSVVPGTKGQCWILGRRFESAQQVKVGLTAASVAFERLLSFGEHCAPLLLFLISKDPLLSSVFGIFVRDRRQQ